MVVDIIRGNPADCIVLAHPQIRILRKALAEAEQMRLPILDIGKELSALLLDVPRAEQSRAIIRWFESAIPAAMAGATVCWQIDLLFEPGFQLDPLTLFRNAARNRRLIVLWPGEVVKTSLAYATPEHHHYRTWRVDHAGLQIIRLPD